MNMELLTILHAIILLSSVAFFCFFCDLYFLRDDSMFLSTQPVVGIRVEWFAWMRATFRSLFDTQKWAFEGYSRYSKFNIPFVIPSIDRGPTVVIPPKQIKKVYGLPENVLDVYMTQNETLQTKWTVWDEEVWSNNFQIKVIRHQMTRNLDHLTPLIATELELGFERWWGTETKKWKDIQVWDSCLKLIAGAGNGAFCGAPLCRDDRFLNRLRDHAMSIISGAIFINCSPKIFKPVSGMLVAWTCDYFFRRTLKICLPYVKERLDHTARLKEDAMYDWTPPKDALQWIIDECYVTKNPAQLNPKRVAHRLLLLNDVSLHSTSFTIQNVLLDLFSHEPSSGVVEALREQCERVLKQAGGSWTRDAVSKLTLVDSTIRESMRLSPFGTIGLPRTVKHPDGILLENCSKPVPRGTVLSVPMEHIHRDEAIYTDALRFNPFRFAQPEALRNIMDSFTSEADSKTGVTGKETSENKNESKSTVTLDDAFLGFGFGRYACPGRFFALNEMKIFLAYTLLNYEIEHLKVRPEHKNIISLKMPSDKGRIRVRRRQGTHVN